VDINHVWSNLSTLYIYKNNGDLLISDTDKNIILHKNIMLKYIDSYKTNIIWTPENHVKYDDNTKNTISLFIKCLKYNKIKVVKFVKFEIIKFILSY